MNRRLSVSGFVMLNRRPFAESRSTDTRRWLLLSNWPAQERGLETLPRRTGGAGRNEEGLSKFFWSYAFISKRLFGVDLITVFTSTRFVAPLLNGIEGRQYQVSADQLQIRNVPAQSSSLVVPKGNPPDWPQRYIALPETVSGTLL